MKDHLKERLNTLRTNKTLIWQTMIVTIGGVLSLINSLNGKTNFLEIILMVIGAIIIVFLAYLTDCIGNNIATLHKELKKEELKNE